MPKNTEGVVIKQRMRGTYTPDILEKKKPVICNKKGMSCKNA